MRFSTNEASVTASKPSVGHRATPRRLALGLAAAFACALVVSGRPAEGRDGDGNVGTRAVYGAIPPDQIEFISTAARIKSVAAGGSASAIWEALEHGERVECTDCIPVVEPLLYAANPETREIAAWWLRRRLFGVFGPGEVYERTIATLAGDPNPGRRAQAANALGEFLALPGIDACAKAIANDADPTVRAAAAKALGRLNDDGAGALSNALADADANVKIAALASAARINRFADVTAIRRLSTDGDATVRRRAAEVLGAMRVRDSVDDLVALTRDGDANVRNAACHALGLVRDGRARAALEEVVANDPDTLVRDQATIALRRL